MNENNYNKMLYVIDDYLGKNPFIICWANGLVVMCISDFGINESSMEPEDEDYIGEYYTIVKIVKILQYGSDDTVQIFNNYIEISLKTIPEKIMLEDGTVLWQK